MSLPYYKAWAFYALDVLQKTVIAIERLIGESYIKCLNTKFMKRWLSVEQNYITIHHVSLQYITSLQILGYLLFVTISYGNKNTDLDYLSTTFIIWHSQYIHTEYWKQPNNQTRHQFFHRQCLKKSNKWDKLQFFHNHINTLGTDILEKSFKAGLSLFEEVGTWMNIRTILYQLSHKFYISVCNLCRVCQDFCHMDRHCYLREVVSISLFNTNMYMYVHIQVSPLVQRVWRI